MERNGDEQVEVELAAVVRDELAADSVHLARVELGHELDLLLGQEPREVVRARLLREGAVKRRHIHDLGASADLSLAQEPVGEEGKLERRHRTLDRHVDQVHEQATAREALERPA